MTKCIQRSGVCAIFLSGDRDVQNRSRPVQYEGQPGAFIFSLSTLSESGGTILIRGVVKRAGMWIMHPDLKQI